MDEYRSLYRKYRPQAPSDVLGQDHVVRALAGAVREGRLAHAFLFSGPRGTGKTSSARILAKMVNCERGPTAEPDGTCEQCLRIRDGSHLDVVEIDAASHGGVDDARELRERAPTAPVQGREKVYIIDEAQRLSREAFDALLTLFEEPPPGVRFVLATTEPHKMPATIAGRCQRFEFRRIPADVIAEHLEAIGKKESFTLAPEAARAIAADSEGSLRDALSVLEQAALLGDGTVTEETVTSLVGTSNLEVQFETADAVAVSDAKAVFGVIHRLVQDGQDLRHFAVRITNHFRNLLLALASPEDPAIVDVPPDLHPRLVGQAQKFSVGELDRILSLLLQAQTDLRWSTAPRLTLELALIRSAMPETDQQPAALLSRVERLERLAGISEVAHEDSGRAATPSKVLGSAPQPSSSNAPEEPVEPSTTTEAAGRAPSPRKGRAKATDGPHAPTAGAVDRETIRRSWQQVVETLQERRQMRLAATAQLATIGDYDGESLELVFPPEREFAARKVEEMREGLLAVLHEMLGITPRLTYTVREGLTLPETDEPPSSPEAAEALVRQQFGAEVVEDE